MFSCAFTARLSFYRGLGAADRTLKYIPTFTVRLPLLAKKAIRRVEQTILADIVMQAASYVVVH